MFPQQTVVNSRKGPPALQVQEQGGGVTALAEPIFIQMFSAINQAGAEQEVGGVAKDKACKAH